MRDAQYHLNIFYMTVNYDSPGPDLGSPGGHGPGPPPAGAPTKQMLYWLAQFVDFLCDPLLQWIINDDPSSMIVCDIVIITHAKYSYGSWV